MKVSREKWAALVKDITEESTKGSREWTRAAATPWMKAMSSTPVDFLYFTDYDGWRVCVFTTTYKEWTEEISEYFDASRVYVGLLTRNNELEYWEADVTGAWELLDVARHETANVSGLFDAWERKKNH